MPVVRPCEICGKLIKTRQYRISKGYDRFCSRKCQGIWRSKTIIGIKHPMFGKHHTQEAKSLISEKKAGKYNITANIMPSPTVSYILGVLAGDGYIYVGKRNEREHSVKAMVGLNVKDLPFAMTFAEKLREIGLHPNVATYIQTGLGKGNTMYKVVAYSLQFTTWYKTLSLGDILYKYILTDTDRMAFIRGFYESEGCYSIYKGYHTIRMANTNPQLLGEVRQMLIKLNYKPSSIIWSENRGLPNSKLIGVFSLNGEAQTRMFISEIKPCIKTTKR
jgi:hypothetical protein